MTLLLISFLAGILTALAPCVLPLLPIIIGGAAQDHTKRNPYIITASLATSIVVFTLLLKFSSAFINIPQAVWNTVSGTMLIAFGLTSVFPALWEEIRLKLNLGDRSNKLLNTSAQRTGRGRDILIGLSLGPVFSSCSPTYFLILATVLPRSLATGIIYLIAYALGLSLVLLLVSILGQRFIRNAAWASDPRGWFKRGLGVLFIIVGVGILTGADKRLQTYIVSHTRFTTASIEQRLLVHADTSSPSPATSSSTKQITRAFPPYHEITDPAGFVNTKGIKLADLIGKKIILVDFMTYSCINCIRTFPYLNAWYEAYKDQGLEIVGIHTPEFSFEKKQENVEQAMQRYGIKFPVVLDNIYGTWNAYKNTYWPRKYLIDLDGNIVFDHVGEGGYEETETKIRELLDEKRVRDHQAALTSQEGFAKVANTMAAPSAQSPETYFGAERNEYLGNGAANTEGPQTFRAPNKIPSNTLFLDGAWDIQKEHAISLRPLARILYRYVATHVYFVASADQKVRVKVLRDGKPLAANMAGADVVFEQGQSYLTLQEERLYDIIHETDKNGDHTLQLIPETPGLKAYTFTFG